MFRSIYYHISPKNGPSILILPNELLLLITLSLHRSDIYHLLSTNRRLASLLITSLYDEAIRNNLSGTILWNAIILGHEIPVRHLLDRGISMTQSASWDLNLLHFAVREGQAGVIRVLMSQHPETVERATLELCGGKTPLYLAVMYGHTEAVKAMLEGGADPNVLSKSGPSVRGFVPLQLAAEMGYEEIVRLLLEYGAEADITMADAEKVPLHSVLGSSYSLVMYRPECGSPEGIVRKLLAKGANVSTADHQGRTAFHWVCAIDKWYLPVCSGERKRRRCAKALYETLVTILIENGADINARDSAGQTPLHYAAKSQESYMIRLLVGLGVDIDALTFKGETPLHFAAGHGNPRKAIKATKALLELGADRGIKDADGYTVYDAARVHQGYPRKAKKLVKLIQLSQYGKRVD